MVNIYEAGPFEGRAEQWPVLAISGALEVRLAETEHEVEQAQRLRYSVFYEEMTAIPSPQMREAGPISINMTMSATIFWWWTAKPMARMASPWWSPPTG